jgi:hypothetical protein
MTKAALRAVAPDEKAVSDPPKTLEDATATDRRSLLVRSRLEIARTIDAGVPAHALARLISELGRVDSEIRRLDGAAEQEVDGDSFGDETFDASAI